MIKIPDIYNFLIDKNPMEAIRREDYEFLKTIGLKEDSGFQHQIDIGEIDIIECVLCADSFVVYQAFRHSFKELFHN